VRDYRGGGRQSARETASRVAAGAIARKVLDQIYGAVTIRAALIQMGALTIERARWDWEEVPRNPFNAPDAGVVNRWADYLEGLRKRGSSCGAIIEVVAEGIPAGLGAPIYGKLDADLASAMMGINAVKGVEIGAGMHAAELTGEENADEMRAGPDGKPVFLSNQAGGILGGISTGQPIVVRFSVKPTSSILTPRKTIDVAGNETEIATKGRHDPCVGIRAVPIGEAMMACVLADHALRHRAQMG
jgi:chorismate synthase